MLFANRKIWLLATLIMFVCPSCSIMSITHHPKKHPCCYCMLLQKQRGHLHELCSALAHEGQSFSKVLGIILMALVTRQPLGSGTHEVPQSNSINLFSTAGFAKEECHIYPPMPYFFWICCYPASHTCASTATKNWRQSPIKPLMYLVS